MPLYAILARDYFGAPHHGGRCFGAISAVASLGMAFGPWAGGWVFDTHASYAWLYIGSFAVGAGRRGSRSSPLKPRPIVPQLAAAD